MENELVCPICKNVWDSYACPHSSIDYIPFIDTLKKEIIKQTESADGCVWLTGLMFSDFQKTQLKNKELAAQLAAANAELERVKALNKTLDEIAFPFRIPPELLK